MGKIYRYTGTAWSEVPSGTKFSVYDAGTWKNPTTVYVRDANTWKTVWNKSNPATLSLEPTSYRAIRQVTDGTSYSYNTDSGDGLFVGAFTDAKDWIIVAQYDTTALTNFLNERPVIKASHIDMVRSSTAGLNEAYGTLYVCTSNASPTASTYNNIITTDAVSRTWTEANPWDEYNSGAVTTAQQGRITLNNNLINKIKSGQRICVTARLSGWSTVKGTFDPIYSKIRTASSSAPTGWKMTIDVTADYI